MTLDSGELEYCPVVDMGQSHGEIRRLESFIANIFINEMTSSCEITLPECHNFANRDLIPLKGIKSALEAGQGGGEGE